MGWRSWFGDRPADDAWDGTAGVPCSGNGASSFHLFWELDPQPFTAISATLEILEAPARRRLYFWALQANFTDGRRPAGGAHLGLQWYDAHPGNTAVNWGGYAQGGGLLEGSDSRLPSRTGNPNTRDYPWRPRRPYRLRIERDDVTGVGPAVRGLVAWRGSVTDLETGETTVVRHLFSPGHLIEGPVVWSEVFAACDEPGTCVRWSDLTARTEAGDEVAAAAVSVNYQAVDDGGCVTTDVAVDAVGVVQRTGCHRRTPQGERVVVPSPEPRS